MQAIVTLGLSHEKVSEQNVMKSYTTRVPDGNNVTISFFVLVEIIPGNIEKIFI